MLNKRMKIIFMIIVSLLYVTGCNKKVDFDENLNSYPKFVSKCVTTDSDDGWFYYFCIQYPKKNKNTKEVKNNYQKDNAFSYVFDGFNIKYKKIDGYYIPIYDESGTEVGNIEPAVPSLSVSSQMRNEIKKINDFFMKEDFNRIISEDDLDELELEFIDKSLLVTMFNNAYNKEPIDLGVWVNLPQVEIVKSEKIDNYYFNIGYYVEYGNLQKVNIDLLYEDGSYLSDLVKNKKASEDKVNEYNEFKKIEEYIIKNQTFDLSNYKKLDLKHFEELKKLLKKIG